MDFLWIVFEIIFQKISEDFYKATSGDNKCTCGCIIINQLNYCIKLNGSFRK